MELSEKIESLPKLPGVYLMKQGKTIIYIGKAQNIRTRVRSYFRATGDTRYAARFLALRATSVDFIVTTSEKEALILEDTLLKKHRPKYNIRLKDDKTYVSIKITLKEEFPRILTTRRVTSDGSRYFGPYASAKGVRDTIKFIRKIFPLCTCSPHEFRNRMRPCLDYQLGICSAPATGHINKEDYKDLVDGVIAFLEGKSRVLVKSLGGKMQEAARKEDFETAAVLRDKIQAIEGTLEEQLVVTNSGIEQDVFGIFTKGETFVVTVLFIRDGRLNGSSDFFFDNVLLSTEDVLSSFLRQFYKGVRHIPKEILVPLKLRDAVVIKEWLGDKLGKKLSLLTPKIGNKLKLVTMATKNAREALKKREREKIPPALIELKEKLGLKNIPRVIEAFDISNISGKHAVGAMVCFVDGVASKKNYLKFRIKNLNEPDDYAMMHEVLSRRYQKGVEANLPDLILIDGGRGHLGVALKVMEELKIQGVLLAAIAKERAGTGEKLKGERIYRPGRMNPIVLRNGTKGDLLLRAIRDEVHRFAINYHRKVRGTSFLKSSLDGVAGIGKKKRILLFERFMDIKGIREATVEELIKVQGITEKIARAIKKNI
ncbi:MAG: excinuclease ABC subunit UvrC [Deltaproteobacteria bacterium]|nr:excinuclease ABC subunit UvrC [Deltaproteobacteria bacterium]